MANQLSPGATIRQPPRTTARRSSTLPFRSHVEVVSFAGADLSRAGMLTPTRPPASVPAPDRPRIDTFVAVLGHELRQPLSALMTAVEVLRRAPPAEIAIRVTAIMQRQIQQMVRLVDDLQDHARWTHGKVSLRKERVDARELIRDAADDAAAAVEARGLKLAVTIPTAPLWVDGDVQRLHQVLSNLLQNAVRSTDPGGHITLSGDTGATGVTVRVRDTGCGIEPEALTNIFDLFAQVHPDRAVGLGIGLSVSREIVGLHEGRIDADSAGPGQGSEFAIVLPAARAAGEGAQATG